MLSNEKEFSVVLEGFFDSRDRFIPCNIKMHYHFRESNESTHCNGVEDVSVFSIFITFSCLLHVFTAFLKLIHKCIPRYQDTRKYNESTPDSPALILYYTIVINASLFLCCRKHYVIFNKKTLTMAKKYDIIKALYHRGGGIPSMPETH